MFVYVAICKDFESKKKKIIVDVNISVATGLTINVIEVQLEHLLSILG